MKNIVVLYHGNCPDGFGGAYAAWKKFGDSADYIAVYHGDPPTKLENKEVYIIDFSYPDGKLHEIEKAAKRLVVLDHHEGAEDVVRQVREHVYDSDRSGAAIAWYYFHPDRSLPRLLAYIQDNDLWRHALPHSREITAYLGTLPFTFEAFDMVAEAFENDQKFAAAVEKGTVYANYFDYICDKIIEQAEEVEFADRRIYAVNAPRFFRSEVGHRLAQKKGPFAVVWYPHHGNWHLSLRGDGSIDLSRVAQKYGGNGHPNAASIQIPFDKPLPFTRVKKA